MKNMHLKDKKFYIRDFISDNMINKKRSWIILILILLLSLTLVKASDEPVPMVINGYVKEAVLGNLISSPNINVSVCADNHCVSANTYASNPLLGIGYYDKVFTVLPIIGNPITVIAEISGTNCRGSSSTVYNIDNFIGGLNVSICCYPNPATSLFPTSFHLNSPPKNINFSWNSGTKGNSSYPILWENFSNNGGTPASSIFNATSPITLNAVTVLNSWTIYTCNGINSPGQYCCVSRTVSTPSYNNGCDIPSNLNGIFSGGNVVMTWNSSDFNSDGDPCYDVLDARSFSSSESIDNPVWNETKGNFTNPADRTGEGAVAYLATYWQVKSCAYPSNVCSNWAIAVTPTCTSTECNNGGGGGGSIREKIINSTKECVYNWVCSNFGACINATHIRACINKGSCSGTLGKPAEIENCSNPPEIVVEKPHRLINIFYYLFLLCLLLLILLILVIVIIYIRKYLKIQKEKKELEKKNKNKNVKKDSTMSKAN
jgi:hypothetical protein